MLRFLYIIVCLFLCSAAYNPNAIIATDSRLKTFVYSENEVYYLKFKVSYQSMLQFSSDESIELISLGDPYPWKITPINNSIFIEPVQPGVKTNMTVVTNKRVYLFEIESIAPGNDSDTIIRVRFYYPDKDFTIPATKTSQTPGSTIVPQSKTGKTNGVQKLNVSYSFAGEPNSSTPVEIFDDTVKTYFRFKSGTDYNLIKISSFSTGGKKVPMSFVKFNEFVAVDGVYQRFIIDVSGQSSDIYNDLLNGDGGTMNSGSAEAKANSPSTSQQNPNPEMTFDKSNASQQNGVSDVKNYVKN